MEYDELIKIIKGSREGPGLTEDELTKIKNTPNVVFDVLKQLFGTSYLAEKSLAPTDQGKQKVISHHVLGPLIHQVYKSQKFINLDRYDREQLLTKLWPKPTEVDIVISSEVDVVTSESRSQLQTFWQYLLGADTPKNKLIISYKTLIRHLILFPGDFDSSRLISDELKKNLKQYIDIHSDKLTNIDDQGLLSRYIANLEGQGKDGSIYFQIYELIKDLKPKSQFNFYNVLPLSMRQRLIQEYDFYDLGTKMLAVELEGDPTSQQSAGVVKTLSFSDDLKLHLSIPANKQQPIHYAISNDFPQGFYNDFFQIGLQSMGQPVERVAINDDMQIVSTIETGPVDLSVTINQQEHLIALKKDKDQITFGFKDINIQPDFISLVLNDNWKASNADQVVSFKYDSNLKSQKLPTPPPTRPSPPASPVSVMNVDSLAITSKGISEKDQISLNNPTPQKTLNNQMPRWTKEQMEQTQQNIENRYSTLIDTFSEESVLTISKESSKKALTDLNFGDQYQSLTSDAKRYNDLLDTQYLYTSDDINEILQKLPIAKVGQHTVLIGSPLESLSQSNVDAFLARSRVFYPSYGLSEASNQLKEVFELLINGMISQVKMVKEGQSYRLLYPYCRANHWYVLCINMTGNQASVRLIDPYGRPAKLEILEKEIIDRLLVSHTSYKERHTLGLQYSDIHSCGAIACEMIQHLALPENSSESVENVLSNINREKPFAKGASSLRQKHVDLLNDTESLVADIGDDRKTTQPSGHINESDAGFDRDEDIDYTSTSSVSTEFAVSSDDLSPQMREIDESIENVYQHSIKKLNDHYQGLDKKNHLENITQVGGIPNYLDDQQSNLTSVSFAIKDACQNACFDALVSSMLAFNNDHLEIASNDPSVLRQCAHAARLINSNKIRGSTREFSVTLSNSCSFASDQEREEMQKTIDKIQKNGPTQDGFDQPCSKRGLTPQ
ncbi:hypothetical protein N9Y17_01260 [Gammaproteobacteria bacterium]|nr:hypothetical protein [Gammaproteobacteria bacterium]